MIETWDSERFCSEVFEKGRFAAVEFYSRIPNVRGSFGKAFETTARRFGERMIFGRVDVGCEEAIAEKYAIRSVPTLMFFCEGKSVCELVGDADGRALCEAARFAIDRIENKEKNKGESYLQS